MTGIHLQSKKWRRLYKDTFGFMSNFAGNKIDKCKGEYSTAVHHMQKRLFS